MELESLREEISHIDVKIMELISERTRLAEDVGRDKVSKGLPIRNVAVEEKVIERYREAAKDYNVHPDTFEAVARALIMEAVDRESVIPYPEIPVKEISIIGGGGKMGRWLGDLLKTDGHSIKLIDPSLKNGLCIKDAASSDVIIVSVPMNLASGILGELDSVCREDSLIFDITSLKTPVADVLKNMAKKRKVCSIHPMFGPSARSMYGRNMIICDCGSEEAVSETKLLFDNKGGNLRVMNIDSHDEYMAYVLGLSHAVNIAFFTVLDRSGIDYEDMCTVASTTFRKNMETNESVALEDPRLYYEIQHSNAFRDRMWKEFSKAVEDIREASVDKDNSRFISIMDAGRRYFSDKDQSED